MVTRNENGLVRVTVTLEPRDVELLDKLAKFEGTNRSAELRGMLAQVRPLVGEVVRVYEEAERHRELLDQALVNASISELEVIKPEMEEISNRFLGALAKFEGHIASIAPASNTGATE